MNTYYLGLDLNLPQNIKILKLKKTLGFSGFGLYVELLLKLAQTENYELSIDDYDLLAYEFRLETKYIKNLVQDFGLFTIENNKFFCADVKEKMQILEAKKEAGRKAGLASGDARKRQSNGRSTKVRTVVEQGKVRKGKVRKENKETNKDQIISFFNDLENVKKVIRENLIPYENQIWFDDQAKANILTIKEKMLNYYLDGEGQKVEIKDMKARFKVFLSSYTQKHFYQYNSKDSPQKPNYSEEIEWLTQNQVKEMQDKNRPIRGKYKILGIDKE